MSCVKTVVPICSILWLVDKKDSLSGEVTPAKLRGVQTTLTQCRRWCASRGLRTHTYLYSEDTQ